MVEALRGAEIAGEHARIAGARVSLGQQFAADFSVLHQAFAFEVVGFDSALVVAQLAHEIGPVLDGRPSKKDVRLHQHAPDAFHHALAMVPGRDIFGKIGCVGRGQLLLNLEEERVLHRASKHQDYVIASADAARANHSIPDIRRLVLREEMAALGLQRLDVRGQSSQDLLRSDLVYLVLQQDSEHRVERFSEDVSGALALCELMQVVEWSGPLGLAKHGAHGRDLQFTQHQVARKFQHRQLGELPHSFPVLSGERQYRVFALTFGVSRLAAGQHDTGSHAFYIPFPRSVNGLVEVVDIENQLAVWSSSERAEVLDVSVAADLNLNSGAGQLREVRGHQRRRAPVERKRRRSHAGVLERNQLFSAFPVCQSHQFDGVELACVSVELCVVNALYLLAQRAPDTAPMLSRGVPFRWLAHCGVSRMILRRFGSAIGHRCLSRRSHHCCAEVTSCTMLCRENLCSGLVLLCCEVSSLLPFCLLLLQGLPRRLPRRALGSISMAAGNCNLIASLMAPPLAPAD